MKEIVLSQNKIAIVDDDDYYRLKQYNWYAVNEHGYWYGQAFISTKQVFMHRFIMNTPAHLKTDHKNNDGLDNRKENLRICTAAQNTHNQIRQSRNKSSKFKGVYWYSPRNRWRAIIRVGMKRYYLGNFKDEKTAALAYNIAAITYHEDFANLNIIE
jgi:hypothetical protein